jgi:hypothetical protein
LGLLHLSVREERGEYMISIRMEKINRHWVVTIYFADGSHEASEHVTITTALMRVAEVAEKNREV